MDSVTVLMAGIVLARFGRVNLCRFQHFEAHFDYFVEGLWITDLTINQILQEEVDPSVRGSVNGVQESLNNALDLLKCVLVIALPTPEQFGLLVVLSFISISTG